MHLEIPRLGKSLRLSLEFNVQRALEVNRIASLDSNEVESDHIDCLRYSALPESDGEPKAEQALRRWRVLVAVERFGPTQPETIRKFPLDRKEPD
jgi:hypothetical protein